MINEPVNGERTMKSTAMFLVGAFLCVAVVVASEKNTPDGPELQAHIDTLEHTVANLSEQVQLLQGRVQSLEAQLRPRVIPVAE